MRDSPQCGTIAPARSLRAQALMSAMLAAMVFMALFVVVEVEHPFSGPVSVEPSGMRVALAELQKSP